MLRRVLLLLLCCILPLQSLQADVGALSHVRFAAGELVSLSELHAPHHHLDVVQHLVHEEGSVESVDRMNDHLSDHCVCPIGCLLPSPSWAVHRVIAR